MVRRYWAPRLCGSTGDDGATSMIRSALSPTSSPKKRKRTSDQDEAANLVKTKSVFIISEGNVSNMELALVRLQRNATNLRATLNARIESMYNGECESDDSDVSLVNGVNLDKDKVAQDALNLSMRGNVPSGDNASQDDTLPDL